MGYFLPHLYIFFCCAPYQRYGEVTNFEMRFFINCADGNGTGVKALGFYNILEISDLVQLAYDVRSCVEFDPLHVDGRRHAK